jgi:hypothetical protein
MLVTDDSPKTDSSASLIFFFLQERLTIRERSSAASRWSGEHGELSGNHFVQKSALSRYLVSTICPLPGSNCKMVYSTLIGCVVFFAQSALV